MWPGHGSQVHRGERHSVRRGAPAKLVGTGLWGAERAAQPPTPREDGNGGPVEGRDSRTWDLAAYGDRSDRGGDMSL